MSWDKTESFKSRSVVEDEAGHNVLSCNVLVDAVKRLQILTKTKELYEGEGPEEFKVLGHNEVCDVFSTLEGLVFQWEARESDDVLRFVRYSAIWAWSSPRSWRPLRPRGTRATKSSWKGSNGGQPRSPCHSCPGDPPRPGQIRPTWSC